MQVPRSRKFSTMLNDFRLSGSKFLLTWAQADALTIQMIKNHLQVVGPVKYAVICQEKHKDLSDHFHAVVIFERCIRRSYNPFKIDVFVANVKKIGKRHKDLKNAIRYVKKDGEWEEIGTIPSHLEQMDKRDKMFFALSHDNTECINSGQFSMSEILKLDVFRMCMMVDWPQYRCRRVYWLWGPTGSGKTRTAIEAACQEVDLKNVWIASGCLRTFFNGYRGQKAVILDDLRPKSIDFEMLLRITDGYPVLVNVKGYYCQWLAEVIWITAPCMPNEMYINHETGVQWDHLDQLLRRIYMVIEFPRRDDATEILWWPDEYYRDLENALN